MVYNIHIPNDEIEMYKIKSTKTYSKWFNSIKDESTKARINVRISRMEDGNFGDSKPVGQNVSELRFFFGSGYRIYFMQHGDQIIILLNGGDKSNQQDDIKQAIKIANELRAQK